VVTSRPYKHETFQENESRSAIFRWLQARAGTIRDRVSAHDILRRNGVKLRYSSGDREESFSCPFHGVDTHPSARVYPSTATGASHVWCFVCQEHWDVIKLWQKFSGAEHKFSRSLYEIERTFGITVSERPPTPSEMADYVDPDTEHCQELLDICERRLGSAKNVFDMKSHLLLGSILDRVRYEFERAVKTPPQTLVILQQIQDKITAKEKQCPEG
jgi:hypothetical protein